MNNETIPSASDLSQAVYENIIQAELALSSFVILTYASFLHFGDEVEYIWRQKFTLPTLLYLFAKYPVFVCQIIFIYLPNASSLRVCNALATSAGVIALLFLIGIQGLILIRTYTLCQGYRPMTIALSIAFLTSITVEFYGSLTIQSCTPRNTKAIILPLVQNASIFILDTLAFIGVIRQVWGLWKMKRSLGLRGNGVVTSLFQQGVLRFTFVIFITLTAALVAPLERSVIIGTGFFAFQNVLSALLVCEFTIDLRKRNTKKSVSEQSTAMNLPSISFQDNPVASVRSVLGRLHESIVAEMGERNETVEIDSNHSHSAEPNGFNHEEVDGHHGD